MRIIKGTRTESTSEHIFAGVSAEYYTHISVGRYLEVRISQNVYKIKSIRLRDFVINKKKVSE